MRTKRQRDLPVLISFRPRWKVTGIAQYVASMLDQFKLAVSRKVERQRMSNRRTAEIYLPMNRSDTLECRLRP